MTNVQKYIDIVVAAGGIPTKDRPKQCPQCGQSYQLLHRHGQYPRTIITLKKEEVIPIFRFLCPLPACGSSFAIVPDFVEKHHQVAVDLKEQVIQNQEQTSSFAKVAEQSKIFPGGPYSEKTLWRWQSRWNQRLHDLQKPIWHWILERIPHFPLPKESTSSHWSSFVTLWHHVQQKYAEWDAICFLHWLHRLYLYSLSVAVTGEIIFPTKPVHR